MAEYPGPEQQEWMNAPGGDLLELREWARASDHYIAPLVEEMARQLEQAEVRLSVLRMWIGEEQADRVLADAITIFEHPPVDRG